MRLILLLALNVAFTLAAEARDLRIATWNLGWHLSMAEAVDWIARCSAPFAKNPTSGLFEPSVAGKPGWELIWGRDAPIVWDIASLPPCDVYRTAAFKIVPVTLPAYRKRSEQIAAFLRDKVKPDVIAFQEVSGEQAIREVMPDGGKDYEVCSFTGYKIQRLGFAWRKDLGHAESCTLEELISLPGLYTKDRVRPGLALALNIEGRRITFLSVHLKSSCVSPLEAGSNPNGKGALAGNFEACEILQKQVMPLERWLEAQTAETDRLVLVGDFNRNLWHERHVGGAVRTDGSDPVGPLAAGVKVRSLLLEVNDGTPVASTLRLLKESCPVSEEAEQACARAETDRRPDDVMKLAQANNLGCRNPIGLDHILVGAGLTADQSAIKIALGREGRTLPAEKGHPDPLLGLSDHCALVATIGVPAAK